MKKKILSIILSISIAITFVPVVTFATDVNEDQQTQPELYEQNTPSTDTISEEPSSDADKEQSRESGKSDNNRSYNIEDYTFTLSQEEYFYDGKPHLPDVICDELQEGTDYEVEYEQELVWQDEDCYDPDYDEWYTNSYQIEQDPTGAGTYRVYISGIGSYHGYVELTYKIVATAISLNKTSAVLYRTGSLQLIASVTNPNGNTTFSSSNTKVAVVTGNGKVTAKSAGSATITVKNGYAKKQVAITVKNPKLSFNKATLRIYEKKNLKVVGKIGNASFKSSNKRVASVNSKGVITGKKKGTCTITVVSNGITLKCKVIIKKPQLSKSKLTIHNSDSTTLKVLGGKGKIKWKSSNSRIASVSSKGKVKGKKGGTCTITAKRGKYTMKCKIKVPKSYEYYSSIPDFGAVYGKTAKSRSYDDDGSVAVYKASKSYSNKYIKLLKKKGFSYYMSSNGAKVYMNNAGDMVAVVYTKGFVAIAYINIWETYEE